MLSETLKLEGHEIGGKHVSGLMRKLDALIIYRNAITYRRNWAHCIFPH